MGGIYEVTSQYLQSGLGITSERQWESPPLAPGDDVVRLKSIKVVSEGRISDTIDIRFPVFLEMEYWSLTPNAHLLSAFSFINDLGQVAFVSANFDDPIRIDKSKPIGIYRVRCNVPGNLFSEGRMSVVAEVSTRYPMYQTHVLEWDSVSFQVIDKGKSGSVRAGWGRSIPGVVRPKLEWQSEYVGSNGLF